MTHEASKMQVLRIRGGRVKNLLLARERSRGLLLLEGFRDRVTAIMAKARSGLLARKNRGHVTIVTCPDT